MFNQTVSPAFTTRNPAARCVSFLLCLTVCLVSCDRFAPEAEKESITVNGVVEFVPLEGGFYGIVSESGAKYDPVGLPEEYKKPGLKVKVTLRPTKKRVSTHMWGKLVRVLRIKKLTSRPIGRHRNFPA